MTENASLMDDALRQELSAIYAGADRHYHGLEHIRALLALAERHRAALHDPPAVEAAIWFHDAVYDSRAKDNEGRSAALAAERLAGRTSPQRLEAIRAMIEATATHEVPAVDAARRGDAALLLDMDLSILGAPPDRFAAYEAAVRREYAWVEEPAWRRGRTAVLRRFLDRPRIFHTATFRALYEARARENIAASLARLRPATGESISAS